MLALIAKGLTNGQIADELYLSIETVKTYVKRLYAKLDVHNRAQAAVAASSHQLVRRVTVRLCPAPSRQTGAVTPSPDPSRPVRVHDLPSSRSG